MSRSTKYPTAVQPEPSLGLEGTLFLLLGASLGALFALFVAPQWLAGVAQSLDGPSPKAYWYLSRAAGIVAYLLLWLSVALGLLITGKLSRLWPGGPTAADLHQFSSLLGWAFALFHGLVLLGDRYVGYSLVALLVPFAASDYRPLAVGLGQLAFYLGLLVSGSFYFRRWIGYRAWRLFHFTSFAVYLLATAHGLAAGTDAGQPLMLALYGLSALSVFFLTVFRVLAMARQPQPAAR